MRVVAVEWARDGVTVNVVAPAIRRPMKERTRASMSSDQLGVHDSMLAQQIPLGSQLGNVVPVLEFSPARVPASGSGRCSRPTVAPC